MARATFHGEGVEWLADATRVTRGVLCSSKDPILLSRGFPVVSNLVGYNCADFATKWVCHLSDPFPPHSVGARWYSDLGRPINRFWARRFVKRADLVTFTCHNAYRYMAEGVGREFSKKSHVLTHLATPKISDSEETPEVPDGFVLGHIGGLWKTRRADLLLSGLSIARESADDVKLLILGAVDAEVLRRISELNLENAVIVKRDENLDPRLAQRYMKTVSVNVACEKDYGIEYSPMILSKYVHGVAAGRPQLMLGRSNSAMAEYTRVFGGGILVGDEDPQNVARAILKLREVRDQQSRLIPSQSLMDEFSPESIIPPFIRRLEAA